MPAIPTHHNLSLTLRVVSCISEMPPKKKEATEGTVTLLKGFEDKETKLIAAAFLSSTGPDKVRQ